MIVETKQIIASNTQIFFILLKLDIIATPAGINNIARLSVKKLEVFSTPSSLIILN